MHIEISTVNVHVTHLGSMEKTLHVRFTLGVVQALVMDALVQTKQTVSNAQIMQK